MTQKTILLFDNQFSLFRDLLGQEAPAKKKIKKGRQEKDGPRTNGFTQGNVALIAAVCL